MSIVCLFEDNKFFGRLRLCDNKINVTTITFGCPCDNKKTHIGIRFVPIYDNITILFNFHLNVVIRLHPYAYKKLKYNIIYNLMMVLFYKPVMKTKNLTIFHS